MVNKIKMLIFFLRIKNKYQYVLFVSPATSRMGYIGVAF